MIYQVSEADTAPFTKAIGIDPGKALSSSASSATPPAPLSSLREMERLKKGDRVALLSIGSPAFNANKEK